MKIKKMSALILAAFLTCTAPSFAYAGDTSETIEEAAEILEESGIDEILSDPENVTEIILSVKEAVGNADVSDDELKSAIDTAASGLGISLDDSEKETLIKLYNKFKNMDINEDELRSQVNKVYDTLESLGVTQDDVKGIIGKLIDIVKNILE